MQERYRSLMSSYYRGAFATVLVFDWSTFDEVETIKDLNELRHRLEQHCYV